MITCFSWSVLHFNSHAHVERDIDSRNNHIVEKNFNSHAHVERDGSKNFFGLVQRISTHTLTWSVTRCYAIVTKDKIISTHTLTWSVTKIYSIADGVQAFQLTRSRGA